MNVLAFFAHPDDETMLIGGTLGLLARSGAAVHYLCATRGEGGENGDPPLCELDALGALREEELRCAVRALGGSSLAFLDYCDPRVGVDNQLFAFSDDLARLGGELLEELARTRVDVLITHGSNGEYGHPAHLLIHAAARQVVAVLADSAPVWYTPYAAYAGHPKPRLMNKDDPANLVIDIHASLEQKTAAALCHRTQHALFVRNASLDAGRVMTVPEVIVLEESLHRASPPWDGQADDPLACLLVENGFARVEQPG